MARTKQEIDDKYKADMDVAESYRADNPERYAELSGAAKDRRADGLAELADDAERSRAATSLEAARERTKTKYPKAAGFPGAFAGDTEAAIEASAKAANDYIVGREEAAAAEQRRLGRSATARAWSPSGTPIVPGTEIAQESGGAAQVSRDAQDRLASLRQVAGTKQVGAHPLAGDEESVLRDLRAAGRMRSTSDDAFRQGGPGKGTDVLTDEDRRG